LVSWFTPAQLFSWVSFGKYPNSAFITKLILSGVVSSLWIESIGAQRRHVFGAESIALERGVYAASTHVLPTNSGLFQRVTVIHVEAA
jgi:hypothetical protein